MRFGLVGAGAVGRLHAAALEVTPGARLQAVCDLDRARAEAVAGRSDVRVSTDHRELLDQGDLDAVVVNTPHARHRDIVVDAAAAGVHVLVEKPMATTLPDCDAMIDACASARVTLAVGHIQHALPHQLALARSLREGAVGRVVMVHDLRSTDYRPGTRPDWFFSREVAGGGALMNIGAHGIDRVVWHGGAAVATVSARLVRRFGSGVETDATLQLELANGVPASITVVSTTPGYTDRVTVVGEKGVLVADAVTGTFLRRGDESTNLSAPGEDDIGDAFRRQLEDFVRAVRGEALRVEPSHARHVLEVVLAAYRSAAQGSTVRVPLETIR